MFQIGRMFLVRAVSVLHVSLSGGVTGALGKVTGALGDAAAKLSFNTEFQKERKRGTGSIGGGVEGAAKVKLITTN